MSRGGVNVYVPAELIAAYAAAREASPELPGYAALMRCAMLVALASRGHEVPAALSPDEAAAAAASRVVRVVEALTAARGRIRVAAAALSCREDALSHELQELGLTRWCRDLWPLAGRPRLDAAPPEKRAGASK